MRRALPIPSSSADGLSVDLTFEKTGVHRSPVDWVSGSAPPAYNKTQTVGLLDKTLRLDPDSSVNPTLQMHATELDTNVASSGIAVDFVSAHGEASIGSSEFLLTSNPASPRGMLG